MKLISCNIEGTRHLEERVIFFQARKADVLALQDVFECDIEAIKQASGLKNCIIYPQANFSRKIFMPLRVLVRTLFYAIMESQISFKLNIGLEIQNFCKIIQIA
jgi:hypothetical protein